MSICGGFLMPHPPIIVDAVGGARALEGSRTVDGMNRAALKIAELEPETIVLITPHGPTFTDAVAIYDDNPLSGNLGNFGAPGAGVSKEADEALTDEIVFTCYEKNIPMVRVDDDLVARFDISRNLDHGAVVPLHFVDKAYTSYRLVCISYGFLDHTMLYRLGQVIQKAAEHLGRKTLVIASGDLSHRLSDEGPYTYHKDGEVFDDTLLQLLQESRFEEVILMDGSLCENAGECGKRSVDVLLGTLDGFKPRVEVYSYEGPFGVGYGVVGFTDLESDPSRLLLEGIEQSKKEAYLRRLENEDAYVRLARQSIEAYVREKERLCVPELLPKAMLENRGGTFVSIKTDAGLRGCMGTIAGTRINLAEEIIENAVKAAAFDPRFPEIEPHELIGLHISVDILGKAEPVEDKQLLDPIKYGVIVTSGYKRGLLLPRLKGIDTVDEQLKIALNKAGIEKDEAYTIERFEVIRHE